MTIRRFQQFRAAPRFAVPTLRQGDLLLARDSRANTTGQRVPRRHSLVVLAGGLGGHRHVFAEKDVHLFAHEVDGDDEGPSLPRLELVLAVEAEAAGLRHEKPDGSLSGEHATIWVPRGRYFVVHQVTWVDRGVARHVVD